MHEKDRGAIVFKPFSGTVSALYETASHAGPHAFPTEALRLVRRQIVCDGAMLNIGTRTGANCLSIFAALHGDDARVTNDASEAASQHLDLPGCAFRFAPDGALALDANGFAQAGIRKLLVEGAAASPRDEGRWIALYRMHDRGFDEHDAEMLHALWPHVRQAIAFNRERAQHRAAANARFAATAANGASRKKQWQIPQFMRTGVQGLIEQGMRRGF